MNIKGDRPFLLLLTLCLLMLNGCVPRTIYPRGETSGVVVDAMTFKPIGGALVAIDAYKPGSAVTDENGAFHISEIKDWEMVFFMAGRAPYDSQQHNEVTVSAPGYKMRRWTGEYSTRFTFPIQLLPESSELQYQLNIEARRSMNHGDAPPRPPGQETFVIKPPVAPPTAATE